MTIQEIVEEPMAVEGIARRERRERALFHMGSVGIPSAWSGRKQHELSGGQRQRVGLARAIAAAPRILLLDEVMSGLDLPAQREVVDLLTNLQTSHSLTYLFITHDLRLAGSLAGTVAVMDRGRIIECSPTEELFSNPREPKTRSLVSAIRRLDASGYVA
jgi:ABC-type dipeptide/oligopeptide/nickel transport system ATPase subunit